MSSVNSSTFSYTYASASSSSSNASVAIPPKHHPPERYRSLSCLAIGARAGGSVDMLARVTVVDYWGSEMLDVFVRPTEPVVDYRTVQTKITEKQLSGPEALPFDIVQEKVIDLISGYIVVGHALWNDLSVLGISHLAIDTRDTALYVPFRSILNVQTAPGLPTLVWILMERHIQSSATDSTENARACMDLFRCVEHDWERMISNESWPCLLPPVAYARYFH
ncbi:unnamed protein product [Rhizoctonia solani]|uniref:Exonuclease domain-containing protein n=1 Tax=Rhizoctonia solani TaxID=456999 RepID=A0A8H3E2W1_9AGAM|nr:unnamed protein product [Rhizoctonia solani]